jgi:hypothetical protein
MPQKKTKSGYKKKGIQGRKKTILKRPRTKTRKTKVPLRKARHKAYASQVMKKSKKRVLDLAKKLELAGKTREVKNLDLVVKDKTECCGHTCPVCFQVIQGDEMWAYYNTCGHCLCGECHNRMWDQTPNNVLCPICRTRWDISQPVFCPKMVLGEKKVEYGGTIGPNVEYGGFVD